MKAMVTLVRQMRETDIEPLAAIVGAAFLARDKALPERYRPDVVRERLQASLASDGLNGMPLTLVAELAGAAVALGQFGKSRWAADSWELMMGATRPDLQGKGLGHALVQARLGLIAELGGGVVFVAARKVGRWERYGFKRASYNPLTGSSTLWRFVGRGRD